MTKTSGMGLAMAALLIAACGDTDTTSRTAVEEREPYEELATAADTSAGFATGQPFDVLTVQGGDVAGGALTATGQLRGGIEGSTPATVTLTEVDGGTDVLVTLDGYEAGSELQAILVHGRCGMPGQSVVVVEPVITVSPEGLANMETTVDAPTRSLLDGEHSVRLLNPQDAGDSVPAQATQACANLPTLD